jgi:hypothetical protein
MKYASLNCQSWGGCLVALFFPPHNSNILLEKNKINHNYQSKEKEINN